MYSFEFIRFCLVGGATFLFDYCLLYFLTEHVGIGYLISSGLAFSTAVVMNYILCQKFVFAGARNGVKQLVLFVVTSIIGLGINQVCMWFFVECVNIHYMLAKVVATGIVTIWNYVTKKRALEF